MMRWEPLLGFYFKHAADIDALENDPAVAGGSSKIATALKLALPLVKTFWPALNRNGMADDFVTAIDECMVPESNAPVRSNAMTE